jgi:hypothetical protein
MPYTAEISRANPSCFLFLIDQSASMQDVLNPTNVQAMDAPVAIDGRTYTHTAAGPTKAQELADAINRLLQNLVIKCARNEGVRDYFHVGVVGYGASVGPAFAGALAGKELVPISEIANTPARVEQRTRKSSDGAGGIIDEPFKLPIWFDPIANNGTPMCQATQRARDILSGWLASHPDCFPPVVINITDGESTDGDPRDALRALTSLSSSDGEVLLYNIHISSNANAREVSFPDSSAALPDDYARILFESASYLTPFTLSEARKAGFNVTDGSKGFVLNASMVLVIQALDIGTRPENLR